MQGPEVVKLFSRSTQTSMEFQLLIKTKMLKFEVFLALKLRDFVFILLINVKMPTIDGLILNYALLNRGLA